MEDVTIEISDQTCVDGRYISPKQRYILRSSLILDSLGNRCLLDIDDSEI